MGEPSALLRRITELERKVERLAAARDGDIEHLWSDVALADALSEHVVMPAILLLAGYGHRGALQTMLENAESDLRSRPRIDDILRDGAIEAVQGWHRAASAAPRWATPTHEDRHPELYPDNRD